MSPALRTARACIRELGHPLPFASRARAVERGIRACDDAEAEFVALRAEIAQLQARAGFDDGEGGANR